MSEQEVMNVVLQELNSHGLDLLSRRRSLRHARVIVVIVRTVLEERVADRHDSCTHTLKVLLAQRQAETHGCVRHYQRR